MKNKIDTGSYQIDLDGITALISEKGYGSVLVQVPEGLKRILPGIARFLQQRTGAEVILDGEICYGACDHSGTDALLLECDALIHIGHEDIPSMDPIGSVPVHFFQARLDIEWPLLIKGLDEFIGSVDATNVGLVTTAQHKELLPIVMEHLQDRGITVLLGDPGVREAFPGQVLGCSFHTARSVKDSSEEFLYIGTGKFHPLGLSLALGRDVHCVDPMTGDHSVIGSEEREHHLRKRMAHIARAQEVLRSEGKVGIVLSVKPGQKRTALSRDIAFLAKEKGVEPYLVSMDLLEPWKVRSLGFKVAVSTACPRIVADDDSMYTEECVILLSSVEFRIALGLSSMDGYHLDEEW
jgi:2-(3-amino-3-carboxypropyl)histidine synthase